MPLIDFIQRALKFLLVDNWPITLVVVLGLLSVFWLLPRPKRPPLLWGVAAGAGALIGTGWFIVGTNTLSLETFLFYVLAGIAIISGVLLITQQNPARAALSFALVVLATCGLFLLQAAPFLMAATIIVYAGAIIVTFLFVLMLAQQEGLSDADARSREPLLSTITGFLLLGTLLYVLKMSSKTEHVQNDIEPRVAESKAKVNELAQLRKEAQPDKPLTPAAVEKLQAMDKYLDETRKWFRQGKDEIPSGGKPFDNAINNAQGALTQLRVGPQEEVQKHLAEVETHFTRIYATLLQWRDTQQGILRPHNTHLSSFSGPSANTPPEQLRRDEEGRPLLPADNTTYLGRSLFSDYLLAVELAGMLLLVATVGAIAIAHRRTAIKSAKPPERMVRA